MFVLGWDCGYRNLKVVYGDTERSLRPSEYLRSAVACPESKLFARGSDGKPDYGRGVDVTVDGERWAAGVDPHDVKDYLCNAHSSRVGSPEYTALFYAALAAAKREVIDVLVTGLPVDQGLDRVEKEELKKHLVGRHRVRDEYERQPALNVSVKKVIVVPQPVGGFMAACAQSEDLERQLSEARVLVIDPGHYSIDWVVMDRGRVDNTTSSTNRFAGLRVLEVLAAQLKAEHRCVVEHDRIEAALRRGEDHVMHGAKRLDIAGLAQSAIEGVYGEALQQIKASVRSARTGLQYVLVVGGGSGYMGEFVQRWCELESITMLTIDEPVMANARGFWQFGEHYASASAVA